MATAGRAVTLKDVKDRLRIFQSKDDAELIRLIADASEWLEEYTGLTFDERTGLVELYDGPGSPSFVRTGRPHSGGHSRVLQLRKFPVTTTTTFDLRVDTLRVFGTDTLLTELTDYVVDRDEGLITLVGGINPFVGSFPRGAQVIQVTYSAGFVTGQAPGLVRQIIASLVGVWYQRFQGKSALYTSSTSGPEGTTNYLDGVPKHVTAMADRLRAIPVGI